MSTVVWLTVPVPNHQRVRVTVENRHTDIDTGEVSWVQTSGETLEQGAHQQRLVYGAQRLLIEEVE